MLETMKFFIEILFSLVAWLFTLRLIENVTLGTFIIGVIFMAIVIKMFMKGRGN